MDLEVRLAYESGCLRGPGLNSFQRWALGYYVMTTHREQRELADRNVRALTLHLAPQRFAELYLDDSENDGLKPDEMHVTEDDLDDFDRWMSEIGKQREMSAGDIPADEWSKWQ